MDSPDGTTRNRGRHGSRAADPGSGDGEPPKRRDFIKILRNVGVVSSAIVGVAKVADLLGVFGKDGAAHSASTGNPSTADTAGSGVTAGLIGGLTGGDQPTAPAYTDPAEASLNGVAKKAMAGTQYLADGYFFTPAIVGDTAYACTQAGTAIAYDAVNGKPRWHVKVTESGSGVARSQTPVVTADGVYIATGDSVRVLSLTTGGVLRTIKYPADLSLVFDNIMGLDNGQLVVFVRGLGNDKPTLLRYKTAGGTPQSVAVKGLDDTSLTFQSRPAFTTGWMVLATTTDLLFFNLQSGAVGSATVHKLGGFPEPALEGTTCYLANGASLLAFDMTTASAKWQFDVPADRSMWLLSSVAVGEKEVFAVDITGVVYAVAKADKKSRTLARLPTSYTRLAFTDGVLYAAHNSGGGLIALDPTSGKVKWSCPLLPATKDGQVDGSLRNPPVVGKAAAVIGINTDDSDYLYSVKL